MDPALSGTHTMRQQGMAPAGNRTKLQRLFAMTPAELLCRSQQEASRRLECLTFQPVNVVPANTLHFEQVAAPRFFDGASEEAVLALISSLYPPQRADIIASADAICRGEFPILGYGRLHFGSPVDWHFDPLSDRHSPLLHWSRIDPLDPAQAGDSKVVWELNRHQWLLDLGQAWRLSGDERYARQFAHELCDWMAHNPPGQGINWSSALEVSLRLIAWCWALFLFRGSSCLTQELQATMQEWIALHATHVARYLSRYFSPNTHLTGEALGLFYAGMLLTDRKEARRWSELGSTILLQQLQRQVHPDGVYFEQSTRYQYYTVDIYLHFLILAGKNGLPIPDTANAVVQRMLDFLLALQRPDGSMPQIGDADGGWLLPLLRRSPDDYSALFSTAAVLFKRCDYAWAANRLAPETLWLLGERSRNDFQALHRAPQRTTTLQVFREGGYAIMRNCWQHDAHHLVFDTGPLGCGISSGHGHADLLSIQCCAFGEPYIVDAGTGSYRADDPWRNYFRSTRAHSTIVVDGRNQAVPAGTFGWQGRQPAARLLRHDSSAGHDLVEARHNAYHNLDFPVTHRRRVVFVKSEGYWIVVDDLDGVACHRIELRHQFAVLPASCEQQWVRVRGRKGSALLVRTFAAVPLDTTLAKGSLNPASGWLSPDYGQRIAAPVLTSSVETILPLRLVTLLYPVAQADNPPPLVTVRFYAPADINGNSSIKGLRVRSADKERRIDIEEHDIIVSQSM